MAAMLPLAVKGKESTQALKNDIYVKRWTTKGRGKHKGQEIVHELHVNAVGAVVGGIGLVVGGAAAAWMGSQALKSTGHRVIRGDKRMLRTLRVYAPVSTTKTVVDKPATVVPGYWTNEKYSRVWVEGHTNPAETHEETVTAPGRAIVFKGRVPIRQWTAAEGIPLEWPQALTERQHSEGWVWERTFGDHAVYGRDRLGEFRQATYGFTNPNRKGMVFEDEAEKDASLVSKLFDPLGLFK